MGPGSPSPIAVAPPIEERWPFTGRVPAWCYIPAFAVTGLVLELFESSTKPSPSSTFSSSRERLHQLLRLDDLLVITRENSSISSSVE